MRRFLWIVLLILFVAGCSSETPELTIESVGDIRIIPEVNITVSAWISEKNGQMEGELVIREIPATQEDIRIVSEGRIDGKVVRSRLTLGDMVLDIPNNRGGIFKLQGDDEQQCLKTRLVYRFIDESGEVAFGLYGFRTCFR